MLFKVLRPDCGSTHDSKAQPLKWPYLKFLRQESRQRLKPHIAFIQAIEKDLEIAGAFSPPAPGGMLKKIPSKIIFTTILEIEP